MHTWYYRFNALFTVATTVLACICAAASLTEVLHKSKPQIKIDIHQLEGLTLERKNERAWLTLDIDADLRSIFTWNTKQAYVYVTADYSTPSNQLNRITLWDRIVQRVSDAHIREKRAGIRWPFAFTDQGTGLRDTPYNLTLSWQTIPRSGLLLSGQQSFGGFRLPSEHKLSSRNQW